MASKFIWILEPKQSTHGAVAPLIGSNKQVDLLQMRLTKIHGCRPWKWSFIRKLSDQVEKYDNRKQLPFRIYLFGFSMFLTIYQQWSWSWQINLTRRNGLSRLEFKHAFPY